MNIDKIIDIKCGGEIYVDIKELHFFQKKLKSIDADKFRDLKESLIKSGLPLAFHIWIDVKGKKWIVDGHHRWLAFKALQEEGYFIAPIPCNIVKAKNIKEAAQVVLISNSRYAKIRQESLAEFMIDFELQLQDLEFLDIPELDMSCFDIDPKNEEYPELNSNDPEFQQMSFILSNEQKKIIDDGIKTAKEDLDCNDLKNKNSNGNALFAIMKNYLNG